ncbi:MAG: Smr/MutS family protein [Anaerolineaceae bacterium]
MQKKQFTKELPKINIEAGMPSLAEATIRMNQFINASQHSGLRVIKIIHGYGSSGVGGRLRSGLRQELAKRKQSAKIKDFIPGEHFGVNEETLLYIHQYTQLKVDPDFSMQNPGITVIILY